MFRCVFDTNTVVSATLFRGSVPEQALFLALSINTVLMSQELATNGDANYIVTGDDDLLVMNPFRGIEIIRPAEFLAIASAVDQ